jgi:hypothetical protein
LVRCIINNDLDKCNKKITLGDKAGLGLYGDKLPDYYSSLEIHRIG